MKLKFKIAAGIVSFSLIGSSGGLSFAYCDYNGTTYSEQDLICRSGGKYRCENAVWIDVDIDCKDAQSVQAFDNSACSCTDDDTNKCVSTGRKCSTAQDAGECIKKCVD